MVVYLTGFDEPPPDAVPELRQKGRQFQPPLLAITAGQAVSENGDEIERLGTRFDVMVEGLRERERVKRTFKKYLAPDVVDYLLAHPEAQELGGTRRQLTVMFSDIVHFTTLAESRSPEEVVAILNRYFTRV